MIRRRAVAGLTLLSALLFCAIAAQSASAAKATNTTGVTCVSSGGETNKDFSDAHCDQKVAAGTGKFEHQAVQLNETYEFDATNQGVTSSTKESEPIVLNSKIGLTAVEITCSEMKASKTKKSVVHNVQSEKNHTFTGVAAGEFKNCIVNKPTKCTIVEPLEIETTFEGVEKLGAEGTEMGVEYKGTGAEETFAELTFQGAECSCKNQTAKIKGSVIGTSGPTTKSSQTNKWAGATIAITPEKEMEKLKFGVESAQVSMLVTPRTPGGVPVSITTTT
jgi:hypothetical protein